MKIKIEFITNSSCASFMIPLKHLTKEQINLIYNHIDVATNHLMFEVFGMPDSSDKWQIWEKNGKILGNTSMDNFDMLFFLLNVVIVDEEHLYYCGCYENNERCNDADI